MRFANVRELKNKTSEILRHTDRGEAVIITSRGKPRAILHGLSEDDLEDYVLVNHTALKAKLEEAYKDYLANGGVDVDDLIAETEKELERV